MLAMTKCLIRIIGYPRRTQSILYKWFTDSWRITMSSKHEYIVKHVWFHKYGVKYTLLYCSFLCFIYIPSHYTIRYSAYEILWNYVHWKTQTAKVVQSWLLLFEAHCNLINQSKPETQSNLCWLTYQVCKILPSCPEPSVPRLKSVLVNPSLVKFHSMGFWSCI